MSGAICGLASSVCIAVCSGEGIVKKTAYGVSLLVSVASVVVVARIVSAGEVDSPAPPGAPGATFKTLNQIESRTIINSIPYTINQSGSYYLISNLYHSVNLGDGITINADEVDLDLNGYALYGGKRTGVRSDDGIVVLGSQTNLHIYNGSVVGWDGDGINAFNADFSIFENLRVSQNDGDGLVADFNCIISQCTAYRNGLDGLEGNDGTVIKGCSAGWNGDNGIQTSEGCTVVNCASSYNKEDGFDVAVGTTISHCTATDNGTPTGNYPTGFGFDIARGGQAIACTAYDNVSNGFDMASACILRDCISSLNSGHGVRTFGNSYITHCKFHENDFDGIRISSTDCHVSDNQCTDNDKWGIRVTSSGSFIVRNTCAGNLTNFSIHVNSTFGPIVNVTGVGDISKSGVANADHPLANFEY
jgi:parallel beta-helix repeat protein